MIDQVASQQRGLAASKTTPNSASRSSQLRSRARAVYAATVVGAVVFVATIVAAPWLAHHGYPTTAHAIYAGFRPACHQLPERSFWLFGSPLAVCARCFGLYLGALLGLAAVPAVRGTDRPVPRRRWLVAAALPMAADVALDTLGIWQNTGTSRALTGIVLGSVAAFYVLPGLIEAATTVWGQMASRRGVHGSA